MNLKRGFERLTLVLSSCVAVFCDVLGFIIEEPGAFLIAPIAFGGVWLVYFLIKFVVQGFKDREN